MALLVLACCLLSIAIWSVPSEYQEGKFMVATVYNLAVVLVVAGPLLSNFSTAQSRYRFACAAKYLSLFLAIAILFVIKVLCTFGFRTLHRFSSWTDQTRPGDIASRPANTPDAKTTATINMTLRMGGRRTRDSESMIGQCIVYTMESDGTGKAETNPDGSGMIVGMADAGKNQSQVVMQKASSLGLLGRSDDTLAQA